MPQSEVEVPSAELVDIDSLKIDGNNPNKMRRNQLDVLKRAIVKWGFIVPVVTNKELLVADGEQRLTVAKELGMSKIPVVRLDVEDVDRRLLRQILNKLKGHHAQELDQEEFVRIIELGGEEDLKGFLVANEKQLNAALQEEENGVSLETHYEVIVECKDEDEQKDIFETFIAKGYTCRVLTL